MDPERGYFRIMILAFSCLISVGANIVHEMYNVLQPVMTQAPNCTGSRCCSDCLGLGDDKYNLIFTIMLWSSAAALPATGFLADKIGNAVVLLTTLCSLAGSCLVAAGSCLPNWTVPLTFAGASLQGFGYLPSIAARGRIIAFWFRGQSQLGLALGVATCVNRMSSIPCFTLTELLRETVGLQWTLWASTVVCFGSFASAVAACILDAYGNRRLLLTDELRLERQSVRLEDLRHFGLELWFLVGIYAAFCTTFFAYQDNVVEFVHDRYGFTKQSAAVLSGWLLYPSLVLSPVFGLVMDKYGRSGFIVTVFSLLLVASFVVTVATDTHPIVPILMIALGYSLLNVLLPGSSMHMAPRALLGTVGALLMFAACVSTGLTHIAIADIFGFKYSLTHQQKLKQWQRVMQLLTGIAIVSFCITATLTAISWKRGSFFTGKPQKTSEEYEELPSNRD